MVFIRFVGGLVTICKECRYKVLLEMKIGDVDDLSESNECLYSMNEPIFAEYENEYN